MYRLRIITREAQTIRIKALSDGLFAIVMPLLLLLFAHLIAY